MSGAVGLPVTFMFPFNWPFVFFNWPHSEGFYVDEIESYNISCKIDFRFVRVRFVISTSV